MQEFKSEKKRVTIKDVAVHAGVSPTAVSLVLNGKAGSLPERTRQRIFDAIKALNYNIDYTARAMVTRKTNIIGVVIPDISNMFFAETVRYLQVEFAKCGYDIILCNSEEKAENDFRYVRLLVGRNVDGLILTPSAETLTQGNAEAMRALLEELSVPYLFLDRYYKGDDPKVVVDNAQSSYLAARYLLENGHRKIGAIAGPMTLNSSRNRMEGLRRAMSEYGLVLTDEYRFEGRYDVETGKAGAEKLMQTDVTAIFAFSDMQAYGVYKSVQAAGRRIPDDISVVGFDDTFYSSLLEPPLMTLRQPIRDIAQNACEMILGLIEGRKTDTNVRLPAALIERGSVKPLF